MKPVATIETWAEMQAFVGKRCTVWIDTQTTDIEAKLTGKLLALSDEGDCSIKTDDGPILYCWPAMAISRAPRNPRIYFDFRDWWVGYFRGDDFHYVCILPTVVIRWGRHG